MSTTDATATIVNNDDAKTVEPKDVTSIPDWSRVLSSSSSFQPAPTEGTTRISGKQGTGPGAGVCVCVYIQRETERQ